MHGGLRVINTKTPLPKFEDGDLPPPTKNTVIMADLTKTGTKGVITISNADFAKAQKEGITRFQAQLDSFRTVDYNDKDTGVPKTICIATLRVGDDGGVVDGVMSLSMIKMVKEFGATSLIIDYTGSREYRGVDTPSFDVKAKA